MTFVLGAFDSVAATDPLVFLSDLLLMLLVGLLLPPAELLVEPAAEAFVDLGMFVELVTGFGLRAVEDLALASPASDLTRAGRGLLGLYNTSSSFEVLGFFSGGLLGLVVS